MVFNVLIGHFGLHAQMPHRVVFGKSLASDSSVYSTYDINLQPPHLTVGKTAESLGETSLTKY